MGDDQKHKSALDPNAVGDTDITGDNPDPESDDDTLQSAQDMGLYQDASDENPVEVGIDNQTNQAEREHQEED